MFPKSQHVRDGYLLSRRIPSRRGARLQIDQCEGHIEPWVSREPKPYRLLHERTSYSENRPFYPLCRITFTHKPWVADSGLLVFAFRFLPEQFEMVGEQNMVLIKKLNECQKLSFVAVEIICTG